MATNPVIDFVDQIRRSALLHEAKEHSDGQLLEGFVCRRDSLALEALVRRHAPMVWGVCRRALANDHDAADAFQTTFLVLVRKASAIRSPEMVGNWLYRVAHKTACKAKQMAAKRSSQEKTVSVLPEPPAVSSPPGEFGPELRNLLDEELSRLPEKYRVVIVLCELEGRSRPEVAWQLCVPEGTVGSRLARARALLAKRLARRGVSVPVALLAALLPQEAASGSVPAALLANTIQGFALLGVGEVTTAGAISALVSTLAQGVLKAMALAKQKAAAFVLLMAAFGLCAGVVAYHTLANRPAETERPLDKLNEENMEDDIAKYGNEADARRSAERRMICRMNAIQNFSEVVRWVLQDWKEPAAKRTMEGLPRAQITEVEDQFDNEGFGPRLCTLEAKLDREKGVWTVLGILEFCRRGSSAAMEVDWKLVLRYNPTNGAYECLGGGWAEDDGLEVPAPFPKLPGVQSLRFHVRSVGKKDNKGGER